MSTLTVILLTELLLLFMQLDAVFNGLRFDFNLIVCTIIHYFSRTPTGVCSMVDFLG